MSQSPVWDTALTVTALLDSGTPPDHPALLHAVDWLQSREADATGDWAVRRPGLEPGGWGFEAHNRATPDLDDTAAVALALARVRHPEPQGPAHAVRRAVGWATGMQSKGGGWGAYEADNTSRWPGRLPFCDFGEVTDPPSADVTAHVVEMLAATGQAGHPAARRAVAYLLRVQETDGSWHGRWGVNHLYGTGAVVPALVKAGVPRDHPAIRRAVSWLTGHQNPDGGWGESWKSYTDRSWRGRGPSTASQTAWALLALLAAGEQESQTVADGVSRLAATQRGDGSWEEPHYTGTGFPADFPLRYDLYRVLFPLTALGRYLHSDTAPSHPA